MLIYWCILKKFNHLTISLLIKKPWVTKAFFIRKFLEIHYSPHSADAPETVVPSPNPGAGVSVDSSC